MVSEWHLRIQLICMKMVGNALSNSYWFPDGPNKLNHVAEHVRAQPERANEDMRKTRVDWCHNHDLLQPSPWIPDPSVPFPSPQAHSQIQHSLPTTPDYSWPDQAQPDHLYLSLISSSFLSLASSSMLPLPLFHSLHLTPWVLHLHQHYTI